jgi:hypothetical protein
MTLLIRTDPVAIPEKEYIFHVLLGEMLEVPYRVEFVHSGYHSLMLPNGKEIQIPDVFSQLSPKMNWSYQLEDLPGFNPSFDLFAFCFFMLSRLEEYGSEEKDAHGRFPARASWAWKNRLLHRPVVNECAEWLWIRLKSLGWEGVRKERQFRWAFSCDVDHPRLWWRKSDRLKTMAAAVLKRKDLKEFRYWLKYPVSAGDPFDVFEDWLSLFEAHGHKVQFNFLGDRPRSSHCWYPFNHPFLNKTIKLIADRGHALGFHPGYEAFENEQIFRTELYSLEKCSPLPIRSGRQHYLRFSNPGTWQTWESCGLQEDSTLGFAEIQGFRCGICQDYPVFDLESRKMMKLRELPLVLMDVSLAQYQKLTPEEGMDQIRYFHRTVKQYGGTLTLLWHNSSWNTPAWEPWKHVLVEAIKM